MLAIDATLSIATPLILAAIGEMVVERSGVINIGIEGLMLAGALGAWAAGAFWGPLAGLCGALAASLALALVFALATLRFNADQIVTGTGINLLALGLTGAAYKLAGPAVQTHTLAGIDKRWMIVAAPLLAAAVWWFLQRTRAGLELVALGHAPQAADTAGIAVNRRRLWAILFGAVCAALGGAYLSIMYNRDFTQNMTDGIGFLALAIVIFGRWHPLGIVAAALFFGALRAWADQLQLHGGYSPAVLQLPKMLPYVISLAALAGVAGRSGAPLALGKPYQRH